VGERSDPQMTQMAQIREKGVRKPARSGRPGRFAFRRKGVNGWAAAWGQRIERSISYTRRSLASVSCKKSHVLWSQLNWPPKRHNTWGGSVTVLEASMTERQEC
jgi:hypothetical protein